MKTVPPKPSWEKLYTRSGLKSLSDRVRSIEVLERVRSTVDDLRNTVQQAARAKLPEAMAVAERWVRQALNDPADGKRAIINATGVIAPRGVLLPLADAAILAMTRAAAEPGSTSPAELSKSLDRLIHDLTGAEAALVLNSPGAALMASLAALGGVTVVAKRASCLIGDVPLKQLITSTGGRLRELGTVDAFSLADVSDALTDTPTATVLHCAGLEYAVAGLATTPIPSELLAAARTHDSPTVAYLATATLLDHDIFAADGPPKVRTLLVEGADLVVFPGDRMLGGPSCGIVAGSRKLISQIAAFPLARSLLADRMIVAAVASTLELAKDPTTALSIPAVQLLSASDENLQHRATRIASQIADISGIESAEPQSQPSFWSEARLADQLLSVWCIRITPRGISAETLADLLDRANPSVLGLAAEGHYWLHLRSVLPRQDEQIVAAFHSFRLDNSAGNSSGANP